MSKLLTWAEMNPLMDGQVQKDKFVEGYMRGMPLEGMRREDKGRIEQSLTFSLVSQEAGFNGKSKI